MLCNNFVLNSNASEKFKYISLDTIGRSYTSIYTIKK